MQSSLFAFPSDFAGESSATVVGRARDEAGVGGIVLAANYHTSRDIFPHNPRYKHHAIPGASLFLEAGETLRTAIGATCPVDPLAGGPSSFERIVEDLRSAGLDAHAWVNYCHVDNFAAPAPSLCRNAFGDLDYSTVCPSSPETIEYARALTRDASRAAPSSIIAEALHFGAAVHGYHHERWFIEVSEMAKFLLGLCFCPHCADGMAARGADVSRCRARTRDLVDAELDGKDQAAQGPLTDERVVERLGEEYAAVFEHRGRAVSELVEAVAAEARDAGCSLAVVEPSGSAKGYATGRPEGLPGPLPSWRFGTTVEGLARSADKVAVLAYARGAARVRAEVSTYAALAGGGERLVVVLRPAEPDCSGPEGLAQKVRSCREAGVAGVGFYHYGFMRLESLGWVREALSSLQA